MLFGDEGKDVFSYVVKLGSILFSQKRKRTRREISSLNPIYQCTMSLIYISRSLPTPICFSAIKGRKKTSNNIKFFIVNKYRYRSSREHKSLSHLSHQLIKMIFLQKSFGNDARIVRQTELKAPLATSIKEHQQTNNCLY